MVFLRIRRNWNNWEKYTIPSDIKKFKFFYEFLSNVNHLTVRMKLLEINSGMNKGHKNDVESPYQIIAMQAL